MAKGCDVDCVRESLGFLSEAQYITAFGANCVGGAQPVFCVNGGQPSVPPRGCTILFGEARNNNTTPVFIPNGDSDYPGVGSVFDLTFTNNTCYSMNIQYQMSSEGQIVWTGNENNNILNIAAVLFEDGVENVSTSGAGGYLNVRGNNFDPYDSWANAYTIQSATALAPGASRVLHMVYRTLNVVGANGFNQAINWSIATRVVGSTVCP